MNKILAVTLIVFATCPAVAETSIVGDVSPPEVIEGAAPRVAPLKTWVPGHQSQHGGWIAPYEKEGGPLPLAPGSSQLSMSLLHRGQSQPCPCRRQRLPENPQ